WTALLGRLFLLTAFLWLVREAGAPINVSIAIVVGASLPIETLQLWLPDQDASITDPVMALGMGLLLRALEGAQAGRVEPGATYPSARNRVARDRSRALSPKTRNTIPTSKRDKVASKSSPHARARTCSR